MSEKDTDQRKDIVTSAEDEPQVIADEALEDANGGWSFMTTTTSTTNVVMSGGSTMVNTDLNPNTADQATTDDVIRPQDTTMLRTRPGRFGNW